MQDKEQVIQSQVPISFRLTVLVTESTANMTKSKQFRNKHDVNIAISFT